MRSLAESHARGCEHRAPRWLDPSDCAHSKSPAEWNAWRFAALAHADIVFAYADSTTNDLLLALEFGYLAAQVRAGAPKFVIFVCESDATKTNQLVGLRALSDVYELSLSRGVDALLRTTQDWLTED
jgi:hypothetical protein